MKDMNNRVIKFRAKRKLTGSWVYGSYVKSPSEDWCLIIEELDDDISQSEYCRVITSTVGQFTGLYDKHGKECYEGDIVKLHDHPTGVDDCTTAVVFEHGCFVAEFNGIPIYQYGTAWIEVIGSIHSTPELLNL